MNILLSELYIQFQFISFIVLRNNSTDPRIYSLVHVYCNKMKTDKKYEMNKLEKEIKILISIIKKIILLFYFHACTQIQTLLFVCGFFPISI